MRAEDVKRLHSIEEVASMYGCVPNRAGFCHCPFPNHTGDRTPSLKLYPSQGTFNCYGCGANGDIFDFVQLMDGCDFKTAFLKLGGQFDRIKTSDKLRMYRAQQKRLDVQNKANKTIEAINEASEKLSLYRWLRNEVFEPMSDGWAHACKKYDYWLYVYDSLCNELYRSKKH